MVSLSLTRGFQVNQSKRTGVWPNSLPQMRSKGKLGSPTSGVLTGAKGRMHPGNRYVETGTHFSDFSVSVFFWFSTRKLFFSFLVYFPGI